SPLINGSFGARVNRITQNAVGKGVSPGPFNKQVAANTVTTQENTKITPAIAWYSAPVIYSDRFPV
ncbi:MAG: hypothetical protein V4495_26690, partial [Pseudomonadota bacterium]